MGCSHGNQRRALRHSTFSTSSPDRATSALPGEEEPRRSPDANSRPAAPCRRVAAQKAHICHPGLGAIRAPIARGWGASPTARAGLWWSVCLLKLGREELSLEVKIAWNVSPRCRRLCQQAQETGWEVGTRPRSGPRVSPWSVLSGRGTDASRTDVPSV